MVLKEKLANIQVSMKANKNLYNSFGKYYYRNAEGICEAVKPFLREHNVSLVLSDEVIEVGGRIYVKATAALMDNESEDVITASAFARESAEKKGQDDSQITGTASSYARKYALNGLFLLDDTKDADTDEYRNQQDRGKKKAEQKTDSAEEKDFNEMTDKELSEKATDAQIRSIVSICSNHNVDLKTLYARRNITQDTMTKKQATDLLNYLKDKLGVE